MSAHVRLCLLLAAHGALAACASSSRSPGASAPVTQTVRVMGAGGGSVNLAPASTANAVTIAHPVDDVWRVLPSVYDSLAIPVTTRDAASRTIGNEGTRLRRQLGRTPLSRYIDCGNSQIGANADSYDVHLSVVTRLVPADGGATAVTTTLEAMARPANFPGDFARCHSRNELEQRITDAVRARLRAP